jgi:hypothetical protein
MSETNAKWVEFINWLNTPQSSRIPSTESEWASVQKVTDRTVRRWKSNPKFIELMESMSPESVRVAEESAAEGDAASYQQVKAQLIDGAMKGNPKALELYFRTYGKEFVAEEAAARTLDLANIDLEDLVARTVLALGEDVVAGELRKLGWRVER